jgi:hypothetical protein
MGLAWHITAKHHTGSYLFPLPKILAFTPIGNGSEAFLGKTAGPEYKDDFYGAFELLRRCEGARPSRRACPVRLQIVIFLVRIPNIG